MTEWEGAFSGHLVAGQHPALLLVDPVKAYCVAQSPLYLGASETALRKMSELASAFRKRGLPVIWTGVRYKPDGRDGGHFFQKVPALKVFSGEGPLAEFTDSLAPMDGEPVFIKQYPSAFFGTSLDKWLNENGVDTVFIGGFSTSGCVRASTLDALQYGFIPFAISDACADRNEDLHTQNLRDLGAKYAEIIKIVQVIELLNLEI